MVDPGSAASDRRASLFDEVLWRLDQVYRGLPTPWIGPRTAKVGAALDVVATRVRAPLSTLTGRAAAAVLARRPADPTPPSAIPAPEDRVWCPIRAHGDADAVRFTRTGATGDAFDTAALGHVRAWLAMELRRIVDVGTGMPAVADVTWPAGDGPTGDACADLLVHWDAAARVERVWSPSVSVVCVPATSISAGVGDPVEAPALEVVVVPEAAPEPGGGDAVDPERAAWRVHVEPFAARRAAQTYEDAVALTDKYRTPVLGPVCMFDAVERLALCIDEVDETLGMVGQLVHALQVADLVIAEFGDDPNLVLTALIHDVGKLLLLTGEDPANVGGGTALLRAGGEGEGLDHCTLQWGADEFAHSRLVDHVPDHVAWLVRYHSMNPQETAPYMDERDLEYTERYLTTFQRCEVASKSRGRMPARRLADFRGLIEERFPEPIVF